MHVVYESVSVNLQQPAACWYVFCSDKTPLMVFYRAKCGLTTKGYVVVCLLHSNHTSL